MGVLKQLMLEEMDINDQFKEAVMEFVYHYKGRFSYRFRSAGSEVSVGRVFDDFSDAVYHEVDVDNPPKFRACDEWDWVRVTRLSDKKVVFHREDGKVIPI